jgi:hypothetical protein
MMRERAEGFITEDAMPARVDIDQNGTCDACAKSKHLVASYPDDDSEPWLCAPCAAECDHLSGWTQETALAVAEWLDGVALFVEAKDDEEYFDLDGDPIAPEDTHAIGSALDVARAYLGGAS